MNKKVLMIAGLAVLGVAVSYGAMSFTGPRTAVVAPSAAVSAGATTAPATNIEPGGSSTPAATQVQATASDTEALASPEVYVGTTTESGAFTGDVIDGDPNAPVTLIEYASLTCPHCASFHYGAYKELKENYVDTGKLRILYRDFPLNDPALAATMVARCGGEDKFLGFIDVLLTQQRDWTTSGDVLGSLKGIAKLGGLSSDQVDACLSDRDLGQNILDRARAGTAIFGVNSTPTIIINGKKHEGNRDYRSLSRVIDGLL